MTVRSKRTRRGKKSGHGPMRPDVDIEHLTPSNPIPRRGREPESRAA